MGLLSKLFGAKVKVPKFVKVDIDEEQPKSIEGNLAVTALAGKLALQQQGADQDALEQGLKRAIPGYEGLVTGQRDVIGDLLSGKVNADVADRLRDRAAARGIATGTQGSQAIDFSELKNYGLTSMDLQQRGLAAAERLVGQQYNYGMAKPMSVTSMFMSPQARLAHETSERSMLFQRDLMQAKMDAAPDPRYVGVAKGVTSMLAGGAGGIAAAAGGGQAPQAPGQRVAGLAGSALGGEFFGPVGSFIGGGLLGRAFSGLFGGSSPTGGYSAMNAQGQATTYRFAGDADFARGGSWLGSLPASDASGIGYSGLPYLAQKPAFSQSAISNEYNYAPGF